MFLTNKNGFSFWQFELLSKQSQVIHFITCKGSLKDDNSKPLNFRNNNSHFQESLQVIAGVFEIGPDSVYMAHQSHSKNIMRVKKGMANQGIEDIDAFISHDRGVCLTVKTADCVPVLLFDPKVKVIAAVHAGWRGTVKKILQITIQDMISNYGSIPENIIAGIGPSICHHCYEIGKEVVEAVKENFSYWEGLITYTGSKTNLNLQETNKQQLIRSGVKTKNIEISECCTFENTDTFYSTRKEGADTGRIISGILLK